MEDRYSNIHVFKYEDNWLAIDAVTLSIFELDKQAVDLICNGNTGDTGREVEDELKYYSKKGYFTDMEIPISMEAVLSCYCISVQNTLDCPLNCSYCFSKKISCEPRNMNINTAKKIVNFIFDSFDGQAEAYEIAFTSGGEPLSNFEVIQCIYEEGKQLSKEKNKNFRLGFTTNTLLLDEEKLKYLEKEEIGIMISVDGTEKEHNENRKSYGGTGSFQSVLNAVEKLKESPNTSINKPRALSVLTAKRNSYVDTLKYLVDIGFHNVNLKLVRNTDKDNPMIQNEDLEMIKNNYTELIKFLTEEILENRWKYVAPVLDQTNPLGQTIINMMLKKKTLYHCDAGKSKFSILPNGDIYPCDYFSTIPSTKMGNIHTGIDETKRAEWFNNTCNNMKGCSTCWARYLCAGTCYYTRYLNNGFPDNIECELNRFIVEQVSGMIYSINKKGKLQFKHLMKMVKRIKEDTHYV